MYKSISRIFLVVVEIEGKPHWIGKVGVYLKTRMGLLWATRGEESVEALYSESLKYQSGVFLRTFLGRHP